MTERLRNMATLYISCGGRMLLLYRQGSRVVNNKWVGAAGGHFEPDELNAPRACILRELREELGLGEDALTGLRLRYITLHSTKGDIRQNYYFFAELNGSPNMPLKSAEGRLQWFAPDELKALEMPLTSRHVIDHYIAEGRGTDLLYAGVADGNGVRFIPLPEC